MVLRNHGLIAVGRSVVEAWMMNWCLEQACQVQIAAMSGGAKLAPAPPEVAEYTARQWARGNSLRQWPALLRQLDRIDPSYRE
jgi:ribulose-5-phosphate 4-epimerase/fuculose-1-phosphate aldolase